MYSMLLFFLLFHVKGFSQNEEQKDSIDTKLRHVAREIMTSAGVCALITLDENGLPTARTMDAFLPENDFTVWLGTKPQSRKVKQIKNNPAVALYYLDKNNTGYVVLHGIAQLIDDQKEKEKHWKTQWEAFYPNKTDDYLLIKVSPKWMEIISMTNGVYGDSITWKAPVVFFE